MSELRSQYQQTIKEQNWLHDQVLDIVGDRSFFVTQRVQNTAHSANDRTVIYSLDVSVIFHLRGAEIFEASKFPTIQSMLEVIRHQVSQD